MSWNDYEICRRSIEMKTTASLFAEAQRRGDFEGMKKWATAMERTAQMAKERVEKLKCESL